MPNKYMRWIGPTVARLAYASGTTVLPTIYVRRYEATYVR